MTASAVLWSSVAEAPGAMQYKLRNLEVRAENEKVRVLKYSPMHGAVFNAGQICAAGRHAAVHSRDALPIWA